MRRIPAEKTGRASAKGVGLKVRRPWTIEIYQDRLKEWRYRIKAANGQVTNGPEEGYKRKGEAARAVTRLITELPLAKWVVLSDG